MATDTKSDEKFRNGRILSKKLFESKFSNFVRNMTRLDNVQHSKLFQQLPRSFL